MNSVPAAPPQKSQPEPQFAAPSLWSRVGRIFGWRNSRATVTDWEQLLQAIEFNRAAVQAGLPSVAAWDNLFRTVTQLGPREAEILLWTRNLTERTGAPWRTIMRFLSSNFSHWQRSERQFQVALAGPRTASRLMSVLPLVSLGLAFLVEPKVLSVLTSGAGMGTAVGGILLMATGARWQRRQLHRAQRHRDPGFLPVASTLIAALVQVGIDSRSAYELVREELRGLRPEALGQLSLGGGESWFSPTEPNRAASNSAPLTALGEVLISSWRAGISPISNLLLLSRNLLDKAESYTLAEISKLQIKATLPLTLCFLPSFILLGIIPLLLALLPGLAA